MVDKLVTTLQDANIFEGKVWGSAGPSSAKVVSPTPKTEKNKSAALAVLSPVEDGLAYHSKHPSCLFLVCLVLF